MKRIYHNINLVERNSFGVRQMASTLVEVEGADDLRMFSVPATILSLLRITMVCLLRLLVAVSRFWPTMARG